MKSNKSYKSNRSRPALRTSGAKTKPRDKEERYPKPNPYPRAKEDERLRETSRLQDSFSKGAYSKNESGHSRFSGKRERFPDKRLRTFSSDKSDDSHAEKKQGFGGKPRFRDKPRPSFRKPRPETKEEAYKPSGDSVLIWGLHAARAAFLNPKRRVTRLWLTEGGQKLFDATIREAHEELLKRPDAKKMERDALDRITPPNSVHQGIVIETAPLQEAGLKDVISVDPAPDLILMLDQVTDPHNVGAILRSAAAFGAGAVVMTERNAPSSTSVLAKSASGALEHVPMIHVVNLARALDELREAGYWCVGLAEEGEKSLSDLDLSGRTCLVLGAEGEGLRHLTRQKCDELARLPTQGPVGSLNVSNAAAVALYEVRRQGK